MDVNGNGSREIVYTFGSPGPNTRIVTSAAGQLLEADLNTAFSSPSVEYIPNRSEFSVHYAFDTINYTYRFAPNTWTLQRQ